jgi:hypothetical protein
VGNALPFDEIIATMDAIAATSRPMGASSDVAAFDVTFAAD